MQQVSYCTVRVHKVLQTVVGGDLRSTAVTRLIDCHVSQLASDREVPGKRSLVFDLDLDVTHFKLQVFP